MHVPRLIYKDETDCAFDVCHSHPKVDSYGSQAMSNATICIKETSDKEAADVIGENKSIHKLLSLKELKKVVNCVLNGHIDLIRYTIQPYSDGKLGFLGSHYRLCIIASTDEKEMIALPFFLKTIPYEVPDQAEYVMKKGVFKQETNFYSVIMPLLCKGYKGQPWAPMCYTVKENLMIFEDLCSKGYSMQDKLFNETLVRAGLSAIARLHAASLLAEWRLGMPFNQLYPDAFVERAFVHKGMTRMWFEAGMDVVATVARHLGHDPDLVRSACEQVYHAIRPSCTKANVISHGDLWGNNLMFNDKTLSKCLLVDYQLLRYSPLAHDVAQFLYLCTDRSFREMRETAMLHHYYEILCETLNVHDIHDIQRPAWSEVVDGMEEQRLAAVITATIYFPTILMDEKLSAQIMNNPTSYAEYFFRDRKDFVLSNMKKDSVYKTRISETVVELAELASRLDQLPKPS